MTRRNFLIGSSLLAAGGCRLWTAERPNLVLGVVSDIHVSAEGGDLGWAGDAAFFERTLRWYREQDVDGIVIAGDLANFGLVEELEEVAAAWYRVFPDDCGRDGRRVEKLFIMGNHDAVGYKYGPYVRTRYPDEAERRRRIVITDPKAAWERCFREPFAPIWEKTVRGYRFVGAHWLTGPNVEGLEAFLSARRNDLLSDRPFFYIQHPYPAGTCYGSWAFGHDDGNSTRILSAYPNAVAFSGHSHYSLTDPRSVWQGAFTSVACSCLRYQTENYSEFLPDGFENGGASDPIDTKARVMPDFRQWDKREGRQGMLVRVYDDRMEIVRRDFSAGVSLGEDWVVPLDGSNPFAPEAWGADLRAPQFPNGARLSVRAVTAQNRRNETVPALELSFEAATADGRVHHYDVCDAKGARIARILSDDYFKGPSCLSRSVTCRVRESSADACQVVPVGWTGLRGAAIAR